MDNSLSPNREDGQGFGPLYEPSNYFKYNKIGEEIVYEGTNNSFIILGRDRIGEEGFGKTSEGRCGTVHLVAGISSNIDATTLSGKKVNTHPVNDASVLYLSQKSKIDEYFYCPNGISGKSNNGNAAAVLKSDDIRIIGRNSIKIITRPDYYLSKLVGKEQVRPDTIYGVELIGNSLEEKNPQLQPIPLGKNLEEFLYSLISRLKETNAALQDFIESQARINQLVINHTHISAYPADNTTVSPELLIEMMNENKQMYNRIQQTVKKSTVNIVSSMSKYLIAGKPKYINSKYHHLN